MATNSKPKSGIDISYANKPGNSLAGSKMHSQNSCTICVSMRFLMISILLPLLMSYFAGCIARSYLVITLQPSAVTLDIVQNGGNHAFSRFGGRIGLPVPVVPENKDVPLTVFTSKNFAVDSVRTSNTMHIQPKRRAAKKDNREVENSAVDDDGDGARYEPSGQHLLVDIKHVDSNFLDSEQQLATAMVELVKDSGLTLLSYHCHSMVPMGVSCVGVLLESHVSFHTWPEEGVITLDLFTCGTGSLIPTLPLIQKLFAVPRKSTTMELPRMLWVHKMRGFRAKMHPLEDDTAWFILEHGEFELKEFVGSTQTDFQRIDIYDVIDPRFNDLNSYERSLSADQSYESRNSQLYKPNRMIFLDGVLQSTSHGDEAYHEILVQPAMFSHPNPRRAAIIGGGEGATLREILKHKSIEHVKMIEIDGEMMSFSRENLPSWNDCSDLIESATSCFDDARAEIHAQDAMKWFIDNFGDEALANKCSNNEQFCTKEDNIELEDKFDVIIMDALDPQDGVEFASVLYSNDAFWKSLYNSLSPNGVMVVQLGISPYQSDAPESLSKNSLRRELFLGLEKLNFAVFHTYEEAHSGFYGPWSYLIVCRSVSCEDYLYANESIIEVEIHKRIKRTKSGERALKYFDGSTMEYIQHSVPKAWETLQCLNEKLDNVHKSHTISCEAEIIDPHDRVSLIRTLIRSNLLAYLHSKNYESHDKIKWISQLWQSAVLSSSVIKESERYVFDPFHLRHLTIH